ncbi:MAG: phosphoglycerate mutase [Rhodospirillales bacterium]|nr:phosphoglycerate mutase [Rhodospirillales bacterium]
MKVVLVRHLAPLIEPGICYGRLDIPMHPDGAAEMARLAADPAFQGSLQVFTSPSRRCRVLADAIAGALAAPLSADDRLLEFDFGEWEGKAWDDVPWSDLDRWAADPPAFKAPGGETGVQLIERVQAFHDTIRRDGQNCAIVSHGGPLKILIALLRRESVDLLATTPPMGAIATIAPA